MAGASFLLSHTGDLQLTDQQVVRLAAIARREGTRRQAMRASLDSVRRTMVLQRRDSAERGRRAAFSPQLVASMTKAREQMRNDLRDAITVLTPDQQAQAWQMIASRARGMGRRGGMGRPGWGTERGPERPSRPRD
jgi:Spy/CpxP family protein refolding chaperone